MKITEFIKKELQGWKNFEIIGLIIVFSIILINAVILKDNPAAIINAICGILYTIIAGKGKISCYFFGLLGSSCYILLSFKNALWGNMLLYLCYYIPIVKIKLNLKEQIIISIIGLIGCIITILILHYLNDKSPIIDGITTFLSILGMYLTVRRAIEQWIVWMVVNGLSFIMWLDLVVFSGTKAYSTVLMWGVYFILAIYFYIEWKKEIKE